MAGPHYLSTFGEDYIRPGASLSLRCHVTGNPTPSVRWILDGNPLPFYGDRFIVDTRIMQTGTLTNVQNFQTCLSSETTSFSWFWALKCSNDTVSLMGLYFYCVFYLGEVLSYLNITSVKIQDGGIWSCQAENEALKVEHSASIHIYGKPWHLSYAKNLVLLCKSYSI